MSSRSVVGLFVFVALLGLAGGLSAGPERITLKIEGLTPSGCSSPAAVRGTMKNMEGVAAAQVSLERGEAVVEFDPAKLDLAQLAIRVERYCQVKVTRPSAP